jgi:hypothetical protein
MISVGHGFGIYEYLAKFNPVPQEAIDFVKDLEKNHYGDFLSLNQGDATALVIETYKNLDRSLFQAQASCSYCFCCICDGNGGISCSPSTNTCPSGQVCILPSCDYGVPSYDLNGSCVSIISTTTAAPITTTTSTTSTTSTSTTPTPTTSTSTTTPTPTTSTTSTSTTPTPTTSTSTTTPTPTTSTSTTTSTPTTAAPSSFIIPTTVGPLGVNFTPASFPNLTIWFDAAEASTLFVDPDKLNYATQTGQPVCYWKDKVDTPVDALNQDPYLAPQLVNAYQNSLPVVFFNGNINQNLITNSITNFNQPVTFFAAQNFTIQSPVSPYTTSTTLPPVPPPPPSSLLLWFDASETKTLLVNKNSQLIAQYGNTIEIWLDRSSYQNNLIWAPNTPSNILFTNPTSVVNNNRFDGTVGAITQAIPYGPSQSIGMNCLNAITTNSPWTLFYVFSPENMTKPRSLLCSNQENVATTNFDVEIFSGPIQLNTSDFPITVNKYFTCVFISSPVGFAYFIQKTSDLFIPNIISVFSIIVETGNIRAFNLGNEIPKVYEKYNNPSDTNNLVFQFGANLLAYTCEIQLWGQRLTDDQISLASFELCSKWNTNCSVVPIPPYSDPNYIFYLTNVAVP